MKQIWHRLAAKIDARHIRERGLLFAALVIILVAIVNGFVFNTMAAQQKQMEKQMEEDRKVTQTIQTEIEKMAMTASVDPETENRAKLAKLKADADVAEEAVRNLQKGLVAPGQIAQVIEDVLEHQGKLRLLSLKKLPMESLAANTPATTGGTSGGPPGSQVPTSATQAMPKNPPLPAGPTESIYKHGLEITVQGQYFDILEYLSALEKMPHQVFWGNARLRVDDYPKATLTLDLFTLSLEKKWLSI